jgi:pilus assembly protein Flp/PilA
MMQLQRFIRDESGQDMMEYGLLAAFLSIVAIATLQNIGPVVAGIYVVIQTAIPGMGGQNALP